MMLSRVKPGGTIGAGTVFADVTSDNRDGLPDGMKLDVKGNLYLTSPGGVRILTPAGKLIGTISLPEVPHNYGVLVQPRTWGKYSTEAQSAALAPI
jgi:sugar lactone lactonase YvrE